MPTNPDLTLSHLLARIAALQLELEGVDIALPTFLKVPARFPAFVNRVGRAQQDHQASGLLRQTWTVHMRLLIGALGQAYENIQENALHRLMRETTLHFAARPRLELNDEPLPGLLGRVEIGACTGLQVWSNEIYQHIGTEFPLNATLQWHI
jgi:hypothetical protein